MVGRTNYTPPNVGLIPDGPDQMKKIYEHFDPLIDASVAAPANLPSTGNFDGRKVFVRSERNWRVWDAASSTWLRPQQMSTFASKSAPQPFANNTDTLITWDSVNAFGITHSAGVFTVPVTGWYDIFAEMNQFSTSAGSNRWLFATKNGTAIGSTRCLARTTGGSGVNSNEWSPRSFEYLAANDTIRFLARQDSGGSANLLIASCGIVFVRP